MKKGRRKVGADAHAKKSMTSEHQKVSGHEESNEQESEEAEDEEQAPPKLAEGFYEMEDIRRKRVRKGQLQFLIKWRGWPETANTWEPYENIQSCPEIIEAFQQRLSKSSKKRKKRKSSITSSNTNTNNNNNNIAPSPKKKRTAVYVAYQDNPPSVFNGRPNSNGGRGRPNSNTNADGEEKEATDCVDKEGAANDNNKSTDKLPDEKDKEVIQNRESSQNDLASNLPPQNGAGLALAQGDAADKTRATLDPHAEKVSVNPDFPQRADGGRCDGARRRKSASVRRFKPEASPSASVKNKMEDKSGNEVVDSNDVEVVDKNKLDDPANHPYFTKIVKAIELCATVTNNVQRVSARFLAMRSDGKEVIIDNSYLKLNNPLLLIDYYEQHLRCGPPNVSIMEGA